jgi:DNA-binding protein H-NS
LNPADLADLLSGRKARKSSGAPKYANPADRSQTWTGRGRKPGWVIEALAAGKSLDSMAI